jgi:hypothetical protein
VIIKNCGVWNGNWIYWTFAILNYNSQSSPIANSHSLQLIIDAMSLLGLLSFTSLLVPAFNGGHSLFLVPKLSPLESYALTNTTVLAPLHILMSSPFYYYFSII